MLEATLGAIIAAVALAVLVVLSVGAVLLKVVRKKKPQNNLGEREKNGSNLETPKSLLLDSDSKRNRWTLSMSPIFGEPGNGFATTQQSIQPKAERHNTFLSNLSLRRKKPEIVVEGGTNQDGCLGKLNFGLSYDKQANSLAIHVIQASDLPAMDLCGSSDPFVRVCLLPDLNRVKVTKVHRRSLAPAFNQTVVFTGYSMKKLQDMTLCMQMMDYDRFKRDDPIGEILLPLKNVKFENCPQYWKNLQKPTIQKEAKGELMLSLCYIPQSNKLTCVVVKAKDLPPKDITGYSDPFVKLWQVQNGTKLEKKKTTVKSATLAPVYNESFTFTIAPEKMEETQVIASVIDYDLMKSNEDIGFVILGRKGSESGRKHWDEMLARPGYPTAMWHPLVAQW